MFPNASHFTPYQYPSFPVPNILGQFPAVVAYNGGLFTRRDTLQIQEATAPNPPPRPPTPTDSSGQKSRHVQSHKVDKPAINATSTSPQRTLAPTVTLHDPSRVQPLNSDQGPFPATTSNRLQLPQNFPAFPSPQWPTYGVQPNIMPQPTYPQYMSAPYPSTLQVNPPAPLYPPFLPPPQSHLPFHGMTYATTNPPITKARHKCSICDRSRSARYHYKHPFQHGQPLLVNICGKCKRRVEDNTDSSEESSDAGNRSGRHRQSCYGGRRNLPCARTAQSSSRISRSSDRYGRQEESSFYNRTVSYSRSPSRSRRDQARIFDSDGFNNIKVSLDHRLTLPFGRSRTSRHMYVESASDDNDEHMHHTRKRQQYHATASDRRPRQTSPFLEAYHPQPLLATRLATTAAIEQNRTHGSRTDTVDRFHTREAVTDPRSLAQPSNSRLVPSSHDWRHGRVIGTVHSQEDSGSDSLRSESYSSDFRTRLDADSDNIVEVHEEVSSTSSLQTPRQKMPIVHYRDSRTDRSHDRRVDAHGDGRWKESHPNPINQRVAEHQSSRGRRDQTRQDDYDWYDKHGMRVRVREI